MIGADLAARPASRTAAARLLAHRARASRVGVALLAVDRHVPVGHDVADDPAGRSAQVPVDWQVEAQAGAEPARGARRGARAHPASTRALPVGVRAHHRASARRPAARRSRPAPGASSGSPTATRRRSPAQIRVARRARRPACCSPSRPPPTCTPRPATPIVDRARRAPRRARSGSTASSTCPAADSLFQHVGAPAGAQPQAPPDNVVLLPARDVRRASTRGGARRHDAGPRPRSRHRLPGSPSARVRAGHRPTRATSRRGSPAAGLVGDNLGDGARLGAPGRALRAAAVPLPRRSPARSSPAW